MNMYYAFDVKGIVKRNKELDCMYQYPRLAPSVAAWSGVVSKTLGHQICDLSYDERLVLKMINYMVYTECVYANLVNQLCYVLANSDFPCYLKELNCKINMEPIARDVHLKRKIKFLKHNLSCMKSGRKPYTNIAYACNINLRNMIAHGSLSGNRAPVPDTQQRNPKHQTTEKVYVRRVVKGRWEWYKNPIDLDKEFKKMHDTTLIWHNALWCYWDVKFRQSILPSE